MKVTSFHFMPHRELPDDFEKNHESSWISPQWHELTENNDVGDYYNHSIDELMHAARMGFDGIGTNEHHQNVYGFMCNPNLFGATLARMTRDEGLDTVALVQLGATITATTPPIRIAEEYAVIDQISGGRLIAGFPVGLGSDVNISYGVTPIEQRERWREAMALIQKAWTSKEPFAWNGKYFQLPHVNLWPRPKQTPAPPSIIPGAASSSTWDYCCEHDLPYSYLSYFGGNSSHDVMKGFWNRVESRGLDDNPYRASILQLVGVAETDELAEEMFAEHVEYFYHKCLHLPQHHIAPPGQTDYNSMVRLFKTKIVEFPDLARDLKQFNAKDMMDRGFALVGSVETVREKLLEISKELRIGHLMVVPQFGSMPHELAMQNIELFGKEVLPDLQKLWVDEGWTNPWWPEACNRTATATNA